MTTTDVLILLGTVLLFGGVLGFFFGSRPETQRADVTDRVQRLSVVLRGGNVAQHLEAVEGLPLEITFDRQESGGAPGSARPYAPVPLAVGVDPAEPTFAAATKALSSPSLLGNASQLRRDQPPLAPQTHVRQEPPAGIDSASTDLVTASAAATAMTS